MTKPKEKKRVARKILTIANLTTPLFDIYPPVKRKWNGKTIIEGVTKTDNFKVVGYTYWPGTGFLVIKDTLNRILFQGKVNNMVDLGKAMKKADKA